MFSRKTVLIVCVIVLIAANIIFLSISSRHRNTSYHPERIAISFIAPFQNAISTSIRFVRDIWTHYFFLVSVSKENDILKQEIGLLREKNNSCIETELSNHRLRKLLKFQRSMSDHVISAEVIGLDPLPWFKTVIIDKGSSDGLRKGLPVVVPEGIVGQVIEVTKNYSKVLLIVDQNSAVDVLVQRTRARGIIKGGTSEGCLFKYVLRKHDIQIGDNVISSGLDGVFPKGLKVGRVDSVTRRNTDIFQEVKVAPYVDFEKFEEVLVILKSPQVFLEDQR